MKKHVKRFAIFAVIEAILLLALHHFFGITVAMILLATVKVGLAFGSSIGALLATLIILAIIGGPEVFLRAQAVRVTYRGIRRK